MSLPKTIVLVLDCADPEPLAAFYATLLDAEARRAPDPDLVEVVGRGGTLLAVRRDHGYAPPSWPRPDDSQQAHVRILVPRGGLDEAEREAVGLGARPVSAGEPTRRDGERLYSDPAGHSFTLAEEAGELGWASEGSSRL
ncbi:VOC family protein [Streptomyces purpureus]|uniref:Extradiol dioxygenase n=1 Tax=Streptomyces purpureus TaxID=1951 RepID=A0A918GWR7_9ACTN|nr:VOC family protein [Streptomyces purpureus]GGT14443.1 extradiol dioxygenase [Streptomyces purpureus]